MNRVRIGDDRVFSIADLEREGTSRMLPHVAQYYNEGAMDLATLKENTGAFNRIKLRGRVAVNVAAVDPSTPCYGARSRFPIGFAPAAMHKMAHEDGELGTSRAAAKAGVNMILSQYANESIEDVIAAGKGYGNAYGMQLCITEDVSVTWEGVRRAEKSGCKAIALSVDIPTLGKRYNEHKNKFALPRHLKFPNLPEGVDVHSMADGDPRVSYSREVTWALLKEIVDKTHLQVFLKGITTAEDALTAVEIGVAGVIVSTHGGRQLDGSLAAIDALPEVVDAVAGRIEVHMDSGIRRGSDIFKALAIGADYCWVGRIPIWGLAYQGQRGVELGLDLLYEEFMTTMALCGCTSVNDINRSHIARMTPDGSYARFPPLKKPTKRQQWASTPMAKL